MKRKITDSIVLHCSDSNYGNTLTINRWHKNRGFKEIGYHYIILSGRAYATDSYNPLIDGSIEIGRNQHGVGAHTIARGYNRRSIGICLVGQHSFTSEQFITLDKLVDYLQKYYPYNKLKIENILGHYELDSKKTCPNIDMEKLRIFLSDKNTISKLSLLKELKLLKP